MMKLTTILAVAGMLFFTAFATTALADSKSGRISIEYVPPKNPEHQQIYQLLKERGSLERLQIFLSPFRLPRTLKIMVAGCDGEADAFYGDDEITICYEYIDELRVNKPEEMTASGIAPIDTVIGPLVDTALHEFAHALFDMLEVPLLGPEEGAADHVAAYIYLQLSDAQARRLISGTVFAYMNEARNKSSERSMQEYANEHGTPEQRAFNVLCMAYGADPDLYKDFATKKHLPEERAEFCEEEYEQVQDGFEKLIMPHIDRAVAEKILDGSWLPD